MDEDKRKGARKEERRRKADLLITTCKIRCVAESAKNTSTNATYSYHSNTAPEQTNTNVANMVVFKATRESGQKNVYAQLSSAVFLPRMISLVTERYLLVCQCWTAHVDFKGQTWQGKQNKNILFT